MGLESSEKIAMRVVSWLYCVRQLGNKKSSVPMVEQCFPLQIERDIKGLRCPAFIRCNDAIKKPHCKGWPLKPHPHSSVKDPLSFGLEVILYTAKRAALRKLWTSPNAQNRFATLVRPSNS